MNRHKNLIFTTCLVLLPVLIFFILDNAPIHTSGNGTGDLLVIALLVLGMGAAYPILFFKLNCRSSSILALGTLICILVFFYCDIFIPKSGFINGGIYGFIFVIIFAPPYLFVTIFQYFLNKPTKRQIIKRKTYLVKTDSQKG
ncbi:hypothetical protein [Acinetobacter boissieri]|uniref:Uncharacterized protein n=1 Tax=Acinetobacter boissieri TaxID=1219383 RepID=A0A1G6H6E5_9GAMM|nr:hypothetical protein [Acinetobacter boissieri]SDB89827.1 hypothetical protein SAMN05421733_10458 [Acinetobacter boissieri]